MKPQLENENRATNDNRVACRRGHLVEAGKSVNAKGWCNLCLKDIQRGRPAGTTAKSRER